MGISNRVWWIVTGVLMTSLGVATISMENPAIGKHGFAFLTFGWVGWMILAYGIFIMVTGSWGLFTDRKKRLADLARCKARREQEAEAAKVEIAKNEDNQQP